MPEIVADHLLRTVDNDTNRTFGNVEHFTDLPVFVAHYIRFHYSEVPLGQYLFEDLKQRLRMRIHTQVVEVGAPRELTGVDILQAFPAFVLAAKIDHPVRQAPKQISYPLLSVFDREYFMPDHDLKVEILKQIFCVREIVFGAAAEAGRIQEKYFMMLLINIIDQRLFFRFTGIRSCRHMIAVFRKKKICFACLHILNTTRYSEFFQT